MARYCPLFSGSSGNCAYIGTPEGGILIDAGEIIAHVFVEQDRSYYELENLWSDAERIPFEGE